MRRLHGCWIPVINIDILQDMKQLREVILLITRVVGTSIVIATILAFDVYGEEQSEATERSICYVIMRRLVINGGWSRKRQNRDRCWTVTSLFGFVAVPAVSGDYCFWNDSTGGSDKTTCKQYLYSVRRKIHFEIQDCLDDVVITACMCIRGSGNFIKETSTDWGVWIGTFGATVCGFCSSLNWSIPILTTGGLRL